MEGDETSLIAVLAFATIVLIIVFVFAKADTKKDMLNTVGLDLSDSSYTNLKEKEFSKYCLEALHKASLRLNSTYKGERDFLTHLIEILIDAEYSNNLYYLNVKGHYIKHAISVATRREEELTENVPPLIKGDINNINNRRNYLDCLWKKYQYPWPKDWNRRDGL